MNRIWLALIVVAFIALFGRAATYGFVWDDVPEVARAQIFDQPWHEAIRATQAQRIDPELATSVQLAYDSYRPLTVLTFWIEIQVWGRRAGPMHVTNLVLGLFAVLLVFAIARQCWDDRRALVVTAIFALHPIQVETLVYVSARGDVLAGVLALTATLAALRSIRATRGAMAWGALAVVAFALSLCAKETCIALPVGVFALGWYVGGSVRRAAWVAGPLLLVAVAWLVVRGLVVDTSAELRVGEALMRLPGVWAQYLRATIAPTDLSIERLFDPIYTVAGCGLVAVAILAVLRRGADIARRRGALGELACGIAGLVWFATLLAPAATAIVSTNVTADRYAFIPLLGLAIALTELVAALVRARPRLYRPVLAIVALWGAVLLVIAVRQVSVWRDEEALYTTAAERSPDSAWSHQRLATVYSQQGRWPEAMEHYVAAVEIDPKNWRALNNIGTLLLRARSYADAEEVLARAVAEAPHPSSYRARYNLGVARLNAGKRAEGCASIAEAVKIRPSYTQAANELARSCR